MTKSSSARRVADGVLWQVLFYQLCETDNDLVAGATVERVIDELTDCPGRNRSADARSFVILRETSWIRVVVLRNRNGS